MQVSALLSTVVRAKVVFDFGIAQLELLHVLLPRSLGRPLLTLSTTGFGFLLALFFLLNL